MGPVAIPPPIWGQIATDGMKGPYHDPSGYRETHLTFPLNGGPVAPMHSTVPMNHPSCDSLGRQALNVRFPYTTNQLKYSAPPLTMVRLFPI